VVCAWILAVIVSGPVWGRGKGGGPVHVRGYVRKDGTYVAPHYRSAPDADFGNNWGTKGNINPYTGAEGTRVAPPNAGRAGSYQLRSPIEYHQIQAPQGPPLPGLLAPNARDRNLAACLDGRQEEHCRRDLLSAPELAQLQGTEQRRNLTVCLSGRQPGRCDRKVLSPSELVWVRAAEEESANDASPVAEPGGPDDGELDVRRRNLRVCLNGRQPSRCNRTLLSASELVWVRVAEEEAANASSVADPEGDNDVDLDLRRRNLALCLGGLQPGRCNRKLLSPVDLVWVRAAEEEARGSESFTEGPAK
jgi:hypothetical protein